MFNRFNCVLDADLFHQYKENNRSLVCSDKALVTVEIREGSVKGRMSNVNNHRNESQYYIALATNDDNSNAEELPLDDLLIGMQYNQLYIKSKRLGKRCKVRQNCMVNPSSLSEVSQLLMQISSDEETSIIARAFQLFQNDYVFLPRISLEDVVVFPKGGTYHYISLRFILRNLLKNPFKNFVASTRLMILSTYQKETGD